VVHTYACVPAAERLGQGIFVLSGIVCAMVGVRFLLFALGADMSTAFGRFMLTLTEPLVGPFVGLFGPSPVSGVSILEVSSLFAIFIYLLATLAVVSLIRLLIAPQAPVAYRCSSPQAVPVAGLAVSLRSPGRERGAAWLPGNEADSSPGLARDTGSQHTLKQRSFR
jgi:hypothetical protein